MTDFEARRGELRGIRAALQQKRSEALLAQEAARRAERDLTKLSRSSSEDTEDERERMRRRLASAEEGKTRATDELARLRAEAAATLEAFGAFTDPTEQLARLPDRSPILLLPLRLETRFKTAEDGRPQLWVRVFPDTCLIDTFEPTLTEQEVRNAQAFWARFWSAAGDEALERAAWRELVAAHGSGRSRWIILHYTPLNPDEKPTESDGADVRLIITAPQALPAAVTAYWEAAWRADGDANALQEAYDDLAAALGVEQASAAVERDHPFNFDDRPPAPKTHEDAQVLVRVLQLTPLDDLEVRRASWSSPSRVEQLPERFVVVAYPFTGAPVTTVGGPIRVPLIASPDPNAPPEQALRQVDDTLQIPPDLRWMFDFQEAVDAGMAMRINLTADQAREGFARLIVLGVRLVDDPGEGRDNLAQLLGHHLHSRAGFELLPQGTPTNNTEQTASGYSFRDDADASFDTFVHDIPQYQVEADARLRSDGQWLADLLALPHPFAQRIPHANGSDQSNAMAMQIALWYGTLGHMMKSQLAPVFTDADVEWTREFFTRYVTGRGPLPALRIGRQPYGILPTTAFDRMAWPSERLASRLQRLRAIITKIEADWRSLVESLSYLGKDGDLDPHQVLLDVLGLHPTSVEYYPLQAESVDHKFYELSFFHFPTAMSLLAGLPAAIPLQLLHQFGYTGVDVPDLLNKIFKARQTPLNGPLIDDQPVSESEPIRKYAGDRNYIEWLAAAARTGVQVLQEEQGFDGGRKPTALLYLMLRHALQLSFHQTSIDLHVTAGVLESAAALRREPPFIHVADARAGSESRYGLLFDVQKSITGSNTERVGDFIARSITTVDSHLKDQVEALDRLAPLPTAKLERVFAEHLDCCAYRVDAWKMGLLKLQLELLRHPVEGPDLQPSDSGLYLGAYGWAEPLRPSSRALAPAELPEDVRALVDKRDTAPLMRDSANQGLIHAPSINHATTAAVLRNGYLANGGRLATNLTSRRVRAALDVLQGMRNGQSLGALLGYKLERYIHDNGPLGVRALIYPLRRAFPLAANQIAGTSNEPGTPQESIAAMNVVDGRKLIEYAEGLNPPNFSYPFGVETLPRRPAAEEQAITDALTHIRDVNDAIADLVLAEGVHQAVGGNYERSAGTLEAFAKGNYPPEPDVIRTPRTGVALTLRAGIQFLTNPPADALPGVPPTPLAKAEPAVNVWLRDLLPTPTDVGCLVEFTDRGSGTQRTVFINQQQLGLHPIDLLYRVQATADQGLGEIDELLLRWVQTHRAPRHDRPITIKHTERMSGKVTWFALQSLLRSLRSLLSSRSLQPADVMRANDATKEQQGMISLPPARVRVARDRLNNNLLPQLDALAATLANPTSSIDDALSEFANTVGRFAAYRLPQTGTGFVYEWRAAAYTAVVAKLRQRVDGWNRRLVRFDARLGEYDALPTGTPQDERYMRLSSAELIVSTTVTRPQPTLADYRNNVLVARRASLVVKRNELAALLTGTRATLSRLLRDAKNALPLTAFDPTDLDLTGDESGIARFRTQLATTVAALKDDVKQRVARVDELLVQHDATGAGTAKTALLQDAGKLLFGEDFQYVPHVTLPPAARDELANAWQHSESGALTRHLGAARDFPVDDWLHGVARVREKLRHWENVVLLGDPTGASGSLDLVPLQLPYVEDEPWLALEIPEDHEITSDRLLYTAHFAEPFDRERPICGLLIDEWTEVIPGAQETTGIALQYDRPNGEAPQSWLLAVPATLDGSWSWEELLAAVVDALESAKLRAVEPAHVDTTPYSWFLPATMSSYTFPEISISNNLLRNRHIYTDGVRSPDGLA
jgi:hypothetical protein